MVPLGAWLKRERERQGVSLEEIAMSTKIGTRFLRALEDEHFDQLPGGIFNKAFVRAYARQIGIDEEEAVASYLEAVGEMAAPTLSEPEPSERGDSAKNIASKIFSRIEQIPWRAGVVAFVLLISALAFLYFHSLRESKVSAEERDSDIAAQQSANAKPAAVKSTERGKNSGPNVPSQVNPPKVVAAQQTSPEKLAQALPQIATVPGEFSVVIKAKEDCWLRITADGKEVLQDTLGASAEKLVAAKSEITLKAGNVGALELWFNGKKLPSIGDYEEVKTIAFDANGLLPRSAKLAPVADSQP